MGRSRAVQAGIVFAAFMNLLRGKIAPGCIPACIRPARWSVRQTVSPAWTEERPTSVGRKEQTKHMSRIHMIGAAAIAILALSGAARAVDYPMVGGSAMYPTRNIIENAMNSKDHTTLVAAVKAGGLVDTLESQGPFTVFAPTNEAFAALPAGTVDSLLKPENKSTLDRILTYHVVPGRLDATALDRQIAAGGGKATLKTVEGDWLTVTGSGNSLTVTDDKGGSAKVTISNVYQSNGVILVIDKVLMPK
jgi:uncharacterized surface protein with fasciclin (FAS1) repeats